MRRFDARRSVVGYHVAPTSRGVVTAASVRTLGLAFVAVLVFALVAGAGSAAAANGNYACPGFESLEKLSTGGDNIACGLKALHSDTEGFGNIALGASALLSNTGGIVNVATGEDALSSNTTGSNNIASGEEALFRNTRGFANVGLGRSALLSNNIGNENVAVGAFALAANTEGSDNLAVGFKAGEATSGSNNIDISNQGVAGDSATTRIGTEGKQANTFVAGVAKTAVEGCSVQVTGEGQLGCNNNPAGSAIATFASTAGVASGVCLHFTGRVTPGAGPCPKATSGYSASFLLSLAMPANGATVSNLYAATSATVTGSDTATVEVIDNTTGATLLSCTVNSTSKNNCSNNAETGTAAAGNKLEVKITTSGKSTADKDWEVTFRY